MPLDISVVILEAGSYFDIRIKSLVDRIIPNQSSIVLSDIDSVFQILSEGSPVSLVIANIANGPSISTNSIELLKLRFPNVKFLVVASVRQRHLIALQLAGSIQACLSFSEPDHEIERAIRVILADGIYAPHSVGSSSATPAVSAGQGSRVNRSVDGPDHSLDQNARPAALRLSRRQRMVLTLVSRGLSNKAIAHELELSEGTIKAHVRGVFKALGVTNRVQAATHAHNLDFPSARKVL